MDLSILYSRKTYRNKKIIKLKKKQMELLLFGFQLVVFI
jgi:hypothetical protein